MIYGTAWNKIGQTHEINNHIQLIWFDSLISIGNVQSAGKFIEQLLTFDVESYICSCGEVKLSKLKDDRPP